MSDSELDEYDPMYKEIEEEDYNPMFKKLPNIMKRKHEQPEQPEPIKEESKKMRTPDQLNDFLKSYFFTNTIVESYTSKISVQLNNLKIMNLDEVYEYFKELDESQYKMLIKLTNIILESSICGGIYEDYVRDVLKRTIQEPHNYRAYDLSLLIDIKKPKDSSCIISLAIVQKGECFKFEDAYALKLICSRNAYGNILIGLYLYAILCHPKKMSRMLTRLNPIRTDEVPVNYYGPEILHVGLLEISGGFKNISGLCLYSKFGFKIDAKLSGIGSNCFHDTNNVAMIKRFKSNEQMDNENVYDNVVNDVYDIEEEKNKIINIVKKETGGYEKHIICNFSNHEVQEKLGLLYNELKVLEKDYKIMIQESKWSVNKIGNELKPEFKEKISKMESEIKNKENLIKKIESSNKNISLSELGITGGKIKKTIKLRKSRKSRRNKKRSTNRKSRRNRKTAINAKGERAGL